MGFFEERVILGSLIYYPETRSRIIPMLTEDDFYITTHRQMFKTISDMFYKGQQVDADAFDSSLKEYVLTLKKRAVALDEAVRVASAMKGDTKPLEDWCLSFLNRKIVPTGYKELDMMLGSGFDSGELIVIKGEDRNSFILGIALNIVKLDRKVLYYSLTLNSDAVAWRLISMLSGIPLEKILSGSLSSEDMDKIKNACNPSLKNLKLKYDISKLSDIKLTFYSLKPDIIIIDSLELLSHKTKEYSILRELKFLAKGLDIPVIILSENREGLLGEPDIVMNVSADSIVVEKNRNGEIGKVIRDR